MPMENLMSATCLRYVTIAHKKEGYKSYRYDAEWDYTTDPASKKYNPDIGLTPFFHITPGV
jgi:hypothetical protein